MMLRPEECREISTIPCKFINFVGLCRYHIPILICVSRIMIKYSFLIACWLLTSLDDVEAIKKNASAIIDKSGVIFDPRNISNHSDSLL